MTTICWDGKTLAADSQTTLFRGPYRKIHRCGSVLFGSSGDMQWNEAVRLWLCGGEKPTLKGDLFHGIIIRDGRASIVNEHLIEMPVDRPFMAVGTGRDFAMAAMHLGKSAVEAVAIAMLFDSDTGGEITMLELTCRA